MSKARRMQRRRRWAATVLMEALMETTPDVKDDSSLIIEAFLWRQAGDHDIASTVEQWIGTRS